MLSRDCSTVAGLALLLAIATTPAYAAGCKVDGVKLDCGSGNNAAVLQAFAADETRAILEQPLTYIERFERPGDLEVFRSSLETIWRKVNRAELRERRKLKRRQISAAQFEEWALSYNQASANYSSGLTFYRTLVWHGKTGKAAPAE